jgi:hypothetical protein
MYVAIGGHPPWYFLFWIGIFVFETESHGNGKRGAARRQIGRTTQKTFGSALGVTITPSMWMQ